MKDRLCHQVVLPFGLLWYFAVFSVASCYCVNKSILNYTENQSSTCPFSASRILTRWEGFGCRYGYVLTPRTHTLLDSHKLLTCTILSVHFLPNLRKSESLLLSPELRRLQVCNVRLLPGGQSWYSFPGFVLCLEAWLAGSD